MPCNRGRLQIKEVELVDEEVKERIQGDLDALGENYKTRDVDGLIRKYLKEGVDVSSLRNSVLKEQQFHRIYFHVSLKQRENASERMAFIHENLLFSDWWHTDELIALVREADFQEALSYARGYVKEEDPFIRRWGYVMFISKLCRERSRLEDILSLLHDDEHYYVQMAEAWLIAELVVFFPEEMLRWFRKENRLKYSINGKAVQKICESYRVREGYKKKFRALRNRLKLKK